MTKKKYIYIYRYRNAITGEYVTEEHAAANPDTTVRERQKIEETKE